MTWKVWFRRLVMVYMISIVVFVIMLQFLLYRANEHIFGEKAVEVQIKEDALYGSALLPGMVSHKLGIVKYQKPEIVALGSSRVMQFRKQFFIKENFYTMGGTSSSIDDVIFVNYEMKDSYPGKVIILGVDLWWLNPNFSHLRHEDKIFKKSILQQQSLVYQRLLYEITFGDNEKLKTALLQPNILEFDMISNHKTIGLMAATDGSGYRDDGSYQYGKYVKNPLTSKISKGNRIFENNWVFEKAEDIDYVELAKLKNFISEIKAQGSQLIVFLPPLPEEIYNTVLEYDGHRDFLLKFEAAVRDLCKDEDVDFYDFSNGAWLDAPNEEFLDGFHGSERTYGKIMLKMADNPILAPYVNKEYIEKRLEESDHPFQIVPLTD